MLVGRDPEEALFGRLIDEARAGRSAVLALVGEAGIGKSALLDHAAAMAASAGMSVLRARGIESEARIPFAGLLELLRPALGSLDRLAEPQREALEGALALRPSRAQDRFAVGAATLGLLAAFAEERPLLVLVDDTHWLDGSSAGALLFALRRILADPVAVLLSVRDGEPSLLDGTDVAMHRVGGLDREAVGELVTRRAGGVSLSSDQLDRLHRGTGGNPLALVELADEGDAVAATAPRDPLPVGARVTRAYAARCASLPVGAQKMLLLAAAGDVTDLPTLLKAAAQAGLDVADLAAGEAAGLVTVGTDRVEFRHPLVRSAVYAGAAADLRREAHGALAAALPDADPDRRAWHLAHATLGPDDTASSALEQAGRRAHARSAYEEAAHAFERAAALCPDERRRAALLHTAADSAWLAGRATRAVDLLAGARRHPAGGDVALPIEQLRGHIATRLGPVGDGLRILLDGAVMAAPIDADRAVVMLAEAVNAAFYAADPGAMREAASRIPPLVGAGTSRQAAFFASLAQGMALIFTGADQAGGAALVREAVALVEASDELADDPRLLAWAAMGPLWLRESPVRSPLVERAVALARERSAVGVLPFLLSHTGVDHASADRWADAEADFHESISLARETGQRTDLAFALARLAVIEARQGRADACRAHAGEARLLASELGLALIEIWSVAALGELELATGELDLAVAHFTAQAALLAARGIGDADLSPDPDLVELDLRRGRRREAAEHLASFEGAAATKGQPWALARAARGRGLLGSDADLDRHFGAALELHSLTPDAFETARTRLAFGGRLRRARRRVDAREQLRAALATFDRLGATPWFDAARSELAATGETARPRDASTRDQLTPQELQVARAVASGRTTREAAAALFLSPKTIEYHLRSIYRKLDIASRAQLAVAIADDHER